MRVITKIIIIKKKAQLSKQNFFVLLLLRQTRERGGEEKNPWGKGTHRATAQTMQFHVQLLNGIKMVLD